MGENDGVIWLMVGLLYVITAAMAYQGGRMREEAYWKAAIPEQMAKLCTECRGL